MSDRKSTAEPVRVMLKAVASRLASAPEFTKVIEFDRAEWNELDPESRQQQLDDLGQEFLNEVLDSDFEVLDGDALDDPVLGE